MYVPPQFNETTKREFVTTNKFMAIRCIPLYYMYVRH